MLYRAFMILAVALLALCVTAVWLWARSYRQVDELVAGFWGYRYHPGYTSYFDAWELNACNDHGRVKVLLYLRGCVAGPGRYERYPRERGRLVTIGPADSRLEYVDATLIRARRVPLAPGLRYRSTPRELAVSVPHPLALGVMAMLPVCAIGITMRRRRHVNAGLCATCDYDLRASRLRCPECGTPIPPARPAKSPGLSSGGVKSGVGGGDDAMRVPLSRYSGGG